MKDINGDTNKSSSQDIISRDTGKKELLMITLFLSDYSILLWFSTIDKEKLESDIILYLFQIQKNTTSLMHHQT